MKSMFGEILITQRFESKKEPCYLAIPFTMNRRIAAASLDRAHQHNNIQVLMEGVISELRRIIQEHRQDMAEKLSLPAYVVPCLAQAIFIHPSLINHSPSTN